MRKLPITARFVLGAALLAVANGAPLVTYPAGTTLENIVVSSSGTLYVTALDSGTIFKVTPLGNSTVFSQVPGPAAGIAFNTDGSLYVNAGTSLYRVASDGTATLAAEVPNGIFMNGLSLLSTDLFLAADDTANTIWLINASTGATQAWSTDPLFAPGALGPPFSPNGIKLFNGSVFASNTAAGTIVQIPILSGNIAGIGTIYASNIVGDDFAFASDGTIFMATQSGEIIRVNADKSTSSIPTGTFGDAAVAFGRTVADNTSLYVVNNGGVFLGLPGGPEDASIVRLNVGLSGVVPEQQVVPEPSTVLLTVLGLLAACASARRRAERA